VLDADPATPMTAVAAELERLASGGVAPDRHGIARVLRFPAKPPGSALAHAPAASEEALAIPLYVDYQPISPGLTLAEAPIMDGSVISIGRPDGCVIPEPAGLVDVLVAGGPGAGVIHRLGTGHADIGSGPSVAARIRDRTLPERALHVYVDDRAGCQVAAYEGVTATLDHEPLAAPARWQPGQQIAIGSTLLGLALYTPPDAALHPSQDGTGTDFNRPPRLLPPRTATNFALPTPPPPAERRPLPILMAVLPLVMGIGMAFFLHQIYLLAMAGLSPMMLIGSALSERKGGRKAAAARLAEYREHKARIERDAGKALDAERIARREQSPDPATVLAIASGPRRRLWERRRTDPDYLLLRVGTADLPSAVELTDPEQDEHRRTVVWSLRDAPVTIPLPERGVVGVAGPADTARAVGRWLVAQAAILHSPNDLRIHILTDAAGKESWEWIRWLPHCRPGAASGAGGGGGGGGGGGAPPRAPPPPRRRPPPPPPPPAPPGAGTPAPPRAPTTRNRSPPGSPSCSRSSHSVSRIPVVARMAPTPEATAASRSCSGQRSSWCSTAHASSGRCPGSSSCSARDRRRASTPSASTPRSACCPPNARRSP
jgi:S-DNA-T family DNA segregation ATPase FtsK/SpoIIIE